MTDRRLTAREMEVARFAANGLTVRQISERLYLSIGTVKTHLAHVYAKLGMKNRAQLARFFLENHPNG